VQAAILSVKLKYLDEALDTRRMLAKRYTNAFDDLPIVCPGETTGCRHSYHLYVIRSSERDDLASHLARLGISTGIHYPVPVHQQPGLAAGARIARPLTVTEKIASEVLSLPLFTSMTETHQDRVISGVRSFYEG
jgi:dTDP-4-amino-4,6-dideoxygalactose transaminase